MAIFTLLTQEMTRNEAQNHRTESVLLTSNKNCRDINFLSVRQGQGPCLFLSDVKDSISLHNSVRYKVWNDFLSNLLTKQASFDRKSRYFYARTRDDAIKRLVFNFYSVNEYECAFPKLLCALKWEPNRVKMINGVRRTALKFVHHRNFFLKIGKKGYFGATKTVLSLT